MTRMFRSIAACLVGCVLPFFLTVPANAVNAVSQGPCTYTGGACLVFNGTTAPIPVIRTFAFNMPTAGRAVVQFDGTMQCVVNSITSNQDVIDLASQIVTSPAAVPVYTGAGGNRHAMRPHHKGSGNGPSAAVNLAASRLIVYGSGGVKQVHFKITQLRMDPGTSCSVLAAVFTVITFP